MLKVGDRVRPSKRCEKDMINEFNGACGYIKSIPPETKGRKFVKSRETFDYIVVDMLDGSDALFYVGELKVCKSCDNCDARFKCYTSAWEA